ncbi:SCY1-like protein 2 [Petromyzon marinus]|uniref:SCY1-like protein 2 n=1 Tax=Petromyzon marinus TaxID=7757 RepID=UPI003F70FF62
MESMLNKLKSTVTKVTADVTSAVSVVLGNPVTREFEITRHVASGGPALSWKIYHGFKKSTKQEVAVFVFEKKQVDRLGRTEREHAVEVLKRGVQQLTRLRHPRLLTVQHPIEESRDCLAFCTEPVFASLSNVLGQHENLPCPVPLEIRDHQLHDVETKYGLLQLAEGLSFLHNGVKMVHGNLTPENIVLNKNGAWKIMGFDFCISSSNPSEREVAFTCKEWVPDLPPMCQPRIEFLAPEYILSVSCDVASDMYSLGMLMYAVFNKGQPIFQMDGTHDMFKSFSRHLDKLSNLGPSVMQKVPEDVRDHLKMLLNVTPTVRPDADQLAKIPYFDDVGAMTLQYLDSLFQRDNLQKSQFFKGLSKVLSKLPKRVVQQRVLPSLTTEFVNPDMVPFVLPNVLLIAEDCTKEEYVRMVLPDLIPVFKLQEPIQVLLIFLQKMDLLLTKTPAEDIKQHVLPMIFRALEAPSTQIQELCLGIIPTFANLIEYPSMKNALIPRIKNSCLQTTSLAVRVNALVCLGKLLEHMDKWYVLDEILPFLQQIPSKEPAVLMGILGIYKCTFSHKKLGITKEILAGKALPHLIPLCIDNNLNLNQFNSYMGMIREMLSKVESEHRTKLEQINAMQDQQKSLNLPAQLSKSDDSRQPSEKNQQVDSIFKSLGLESSSSPSQPPNGANSRENGPASSQHGKVSLSLEEKQKLAKDQEQAHKLRSQPTLNPKPSAATAAKPQAKNLTATLIAGPPSMGSLAIGQQQPAMPSTQTAGYGNPSGGGFTGSSGGFPIAASTSMSSGGGGGGFGVGATMGNPAGFNASASPSAFVSSPMNSGAAFAGGGGGATFGQGAFGNGVPRLPQSGSIPNFPAAPFGGGGGGLHQQSGAGAQQKPVNLASFDDLFGPQKPKVSLNQIRPPMQQPAAPSPWLNQFASQPGAQGFVGAPPRAGVPMMAPPQNVGVPMYQGNPFMLPPPQGFQQGATVNQSSNTGGDALKDLLG